MRFGINDVSEASYFKILVSKVSVISSSKLSASLSNSWFLLLSKMGYTIIISPFSSNTSPSLKSYNIRSCIIFKLYASYLFYFHLWYLNPSLIISSGPLCFSIIILHPVSFRASLCKIRRAIYSKSDDSCSLSVFNISITCRINWGYFKISSCKFVLGLHNSLWTPSSKLYKHMIRMNNCTWREPGSLSCRLERSSKFD